MPDGDGQGSTGSQGDEQATTTDDGGTTQGGQTQGGSPGTEPFDRDRAMATIDAQRKSEKELQGALAAANARLKEYEDAKLSEQDRATKRIAELESERDTLATTLQDINTRGAIERAASAAGAMYPDAVARVVDRSALVFGKDGDITNMDAVMADTLKRYPALFGRNGSGDGGPRGDVGGAGDGDMNATIRRLAGR
jgi:hypothetical protein